MSFAILLHGLPESAVGEGFDVAARLPLAQHVARACLVLVVLQADGSGIAEGECALGIGRDLFEQVAFSPSLRC